MALCVGGPATSLFPRVQHDQLTAKAFKSSQQKGTGTIKLSPAQAKFLADRPEDCVSEHLMEEFFGYEPEEGYTAEQHQQCAAAISKVYAYFGETCAGSLVSGGVIQDTVSATSPADPSAGSL